MKEKIISKSIGAGLLAMSVLASGGVATLSSISLAPTAYAQTVESNSNITDPRGYTYNELLDMGWTKPIPEMSTIKPSIDIVGVQVNGDPVEGYVRGNNRINDMVEINPDDDTIIKYTVKNLTDEPYKIDIRDSSERDDGIRGTSLVLGGIRLDNNYTIVSGNNVTLNAGEETDIEILIPGGTFPHEEILNIPIGSINLSEILYSEKDQLWGDLNFNGVDLSSSPNITFTDITATVLEPFDGGNNIFRGRYLVSPTSPYALVYGSINPDERTTPFNTPIKINILDNDNLTKYGTEENSWKQVGFIVNEYYEPADATVPIAIYDKTLKVEEGVFSINDDNTITFTPKDGFIGKVPQIQYWASENNSNGSLRGPDMTDLGDGRIGHPGFYGDTSTIDVTVLPPEPVISPDDFTHDYSEGLNTIVKIENNDESKGKLTLIDSKGTPVETIPVVINGQQAGTGYINENKEFVITWNEEGITGSIEEIRYQITDENGSTVQTTINGKVTNTIPAIPLTPAPNAQDDVFNHTVGESNTTIVKIVDNDGEFGGDITLIDSDGKPVDSIPVTINGEEAGIGSLNQNNEFVIIWNDKGLTGEIDPVSYIITNEDGSSSKAIITGTVDDVEETPEPTDPVVTPEPTDPVVTPEPTNPVVTPEPTPEPEEVTPTPEEATPEIEKEENVVTEDSTDKETDSKDSVFIKTGEIAQGMNLPLAIGLLALSAGSAILLSLRSRRKKS